MPITQRLYEKNASALNVIPSPSITATPSTTVSATPSISVTPSVTPSLSLTPSISTTPSSTPSNTPTPTPSVSTAYFYLANVFTCYGSTDCGQFVGQSAIYNGTNDFTIGHYYTGSNHRIYQPISLTTSGSGAITVNSTSYNSCALACSASYNV